MSRSPVSPQFLSGLRHRATTYLARNVLVDFCVVFLRVFLALHLNCVHFLSSLILLSSSALIRLVCTGYRFCKLQRVTSLVGGIFRSPTLLRRDDSVFLKCHPSHSSMFCLRAHAIASEFLSPGVVFFLWMWVGPWLWVGSWHHGIMADIVIISISFLCWCSCSASSIGYFLSR